MKNNREFAQKIIRKFDPGFLQRWEIYDGIVKKLSGKDVRRLDCGCGDNSAISEFPCGFSVGIDIYFHPEIRKIPPDNFVLGNIESLPFKDNSFDFVTLNTVVEHLENPESFFDEIHRVLRNGGKVLIHTTNINSPFVMAGKIFPENIRVSLFEKIFGGKSRDIFKTYHRINAFKKFNNIKGFKLIEFYPVQDLNYTNRLVFLLFFMGHLLSKIKGLWRLRTNLIILLKKD